MTSAEHLVARQVATYEIKRRLVAEGESEGAGRVKVEGVSYGPCLLISRECGSGGRSLAHRAAVRLGWRVFDREIVEEIAQRAHMREALVEKVDEQVRARWQSALDRLLVGDRECQEVYLFQLRQVVETLGHHGEVVIVGRGAQYILPAACAVRVRAVAPKDVRAKRVAERAGISTERALLQIEKDDAERSRFIRETFDQDPGSLLGYDVVINTGQMTLDAATETVLAALRGKLGVREIESRAEGTKRAA